MNDKEIAAVAFICFVILMTGVYYGVKYWNDNHASPVTPTTSTSTTHATTMSSSTPTLSTTPAFTTAPTSNDPATTRDIARSTTSALTTAPTSNNPATTRDITPSTTPGSTTSTTPAPVRNIADLTPCALLKPPFNYACINALWKGAGCTLDIPSDQYEAHKNLDFQYLAAEAFPRWSQVNPPSICKAVENKAVVQNVPICQNQTNPLNYACVNTLWKNAGCVKDLSQDQYDVHKSLGFQYLATEAFPRWANAAPPNICK
jgi:hypothetical protein